MIDRINYYLSFPIYQTLTNTAMRKYRVGLYFILFNCFATAGTYAQSCFSSNNNSVINFSCGLNCGNINLQVPDLKTSSDYIVNSINYNPYPFVTAAPALTVPCSSQDDKFFDPIVLPFSFCFYDSVFTKCVLGTNGVITFDLSNTLLGNNWDLDPPLSIPNTGTGDPGAICAQPNGTLYPRAAIMGPYTDLFPQLTDPLYKIESRVEGTAPCRRFIVSFSQVPLFNCLSSRVTSQMVLYETTGIIEIFIQSKPFCFFNGNIGVIAIQDWTRTKGRTPPSRDAGSWIAQNEAYRFVPSGGATRFINSQLFTLGGSLVATATTSFAVPGSIGLSFPNICLSANSERFVVRTRYNSCADPNAVFITEDTITVNKTSALGATANITDLSCATGSAGSISVSVTPNSGVPPFQYSINGGTLQSSNIFAGLASGTYTVFATDINGCSTTLNNVTVNRTGNLGVGYTSTTASCSGINNGSITILPPSVYTPLQYSINAGPPQTSNIFSGLAAGSYTISVTDAIGCTGSTNITITQGSGITATFTTTPTSCSGANNGTITVTPGGGNFPYQYSINGGPLQSSNTFNGLAPGNYSIGVADVNGCNSSFPVVINQSSALNANVTKTNVRCNGAANGTITINVSNGSAPYQYSLDNVTWQTSNTFTGLAPASYTVYYRDNNACTNSQPVTITQPAVLNTTLTSNAPRCFGYSDGTITVAATGGTISYQYSVDNINWQGSNFLTGLSAGPYTVYCRDANGCTATNTITITQPALFTATAAVTDASCNGGADGQITITPTGGTAPYYYSATVPTLQLLNVIKVAPGTYNILLADANVCVYSIPNVVVGLNNNLSVAASPDVTICEGTSTQLNVMGNATQFSWTQGTSLNNANVQNPLAAPSVTTQYIVTATLGQCSGNDTVVVNVNPAPIPDAGPDGDICYGQDYRLQGSGGVQFAWVASPTLSNTSIPNPLSTPTQTTTYSLNVVDSIGCSSQVPDQVIVKVTPPIIVKTFPSDTVVFSGDKFQLLATSAATDYSWSPPFGLSDPFIANPVLTVTSDITFNIIASTSAGCKGDGTVNIKVFKGPEIYVPTGFTPNGDGKNDKFKPFTVGITKLNYFRVYNRWGRLVFSTANFNEGWDGRLGGVDQPASTFVWMVQGVTRDGKVITKKGIVTLIR